MTVYETRQPYSSAQKYLNKPEGKNLCEEFVLYTTYIVLHIATIQKVLIARFIQILLYGGKRLACFIRRSYEAAIN